MVTVSQMFRWSLRLWIVGGYEPVPILSLCGIEIITQWKQTGFQWEMVYSHIYIQWALTMEIIEILELSFSVFDYGCLFWSKEWSLMVVPKVPVVLKERFHQ